MNARVWVIECLSLGECLSARERNGWRGERQRGREEENLSLYMINFLVTFTRTSFVTPEDSEEYLVNQEYFIKQ